MKCPLKWYRMAAEQGFAPAQRNLGCMYHDGEGVPADIEESVKWFLMAAEQGDYNAQFALYNMYQSGEISDD